MATKLVFLPVNNTKYDLVSLGETMMRIDPVDFPIERANFARIWHGGGETNVAEGITYAFKMRGAIVTALVDDGIGRNIEGQIRAAGVDTSNIIWFKNNGKGIFFTDAKGTLHNGINFTWRGKGILPSVTEYYRAHTPSSVLKPGDFDWDVLFRSGVRWFHSGGIFGCIGPNTAEFLIEGMRTAKKYGTFVSFDLNYRSKVEPNKEKAQSNNHLIVSNADFLVGNQSDFSDALGYKTKAIGKNESMDVYMAAYTDMFKTVAKDYPNLKIIGTQLRTALSADLINWGAVLYDIEEDIIFNAKARERIEIYDRTGGGDSFCSGVAGSLLMGRSIEEAVEYGAAHGIIVQEFPGDTTMASLSMIENEIMRAKKGGGVSALR